VPRPMASAAVQMFWANMMVSWKLIQKWRKALVAVNGATSSPAHLRSLR